jgi:mannose-1-phosphate guanylyltransferase
MNLYAVVLAGGRGTRLWPLSRKSRPKQFLSLAEGGLSLLQSAVKRAEQVVGDINQVLVVAPFDQKELIQEQLPALPSDNLALEPTGRNTAAAVGLSAIQIQNRDPQAVIGIFPADHLFKDLHPWIEAVQTGLDFAGDSDQLVTIGLEPITPSPSYGYLHLGHALASRSKLPVYKVRRFIEKPTTGVAQKYLASGEYLWNTGTFAWKVSTILDAFREHLPAHFDGLQKIKNAKQSADVISEIYPSLENISIDYGVMEKSSNVAVVKACFERIDLGNLSNLAELFPADSGCNSFYGDVLVIDGENNLIYDDTGVGITATFGLSDVILIRQDDVVLALPKKEAYRIKDLLDEIRHRGMEQYL